MRLHELFISVAIIFVILLAIVFKDAKADDSIIFHAISKHTEGPAEQEPYNETNYTIGYESIKGKHGISVQVYKDSYYTIAKTVAAIYVPYQGKYHKLGIIYGIIDSPSYGNGDAMFMLLPYVSLKIYKGLGINVMYIPKKEDTDSHVLGVQFKINANTIKRIFK